MSAEIPDSWYAVAWSADLPVAGVEPLRVLGRELVLFRGEDDVARVFDAHCRHLGAHLGYGGVVEGCALRCPFHGWRWEPDGSCSDVPYAKRIPQGARIRSWSTDESNGAVYVWYAAEGGAPPCQPPSLEGVAADAWRGARQRRWKSRATLADVADLGFDPWRDETPPRSVEMVVPAPGAVQLLRFGGESECVAAIHRTPIDTEVLDVRLTLAPGTEALAEDLAARVERDLGLLADKVLLPNPIRIPEDASYAKERS